MSQYVGTIEFAKYPRQLLTDHWDKSGFATQCSVIGKKFNQSEGSMTLVMTWLNKWSAVQAAYYPVKVPV